MIVVSNEQIQHFTDLRVEGFAAELAERARQRHSDALAEIPDDKLRDLMAEEIKAARSFGISVRRDLERFSDLAVVLGFGFSESEDWANAILSKDSESPSFRLGKVEDAAVFVALAR